MSESISRTDLRRTIRETIRERDTPPTRTALVDSVADATGADLEAVDSEIDVLERQGGVYIVNGTVKLP